MPQRLMSLMFILIIFGLTINDVTARGFSVGGRGSFGSARSNHAFMHAPFFKNNKNTRSMKSNQHQRWRGTLTGLLLGSLLTSLFMGHGFGSAMISWLFLGICMFFIINFLRRKQNNNWRS